jgi:hypothetical protein
MLEELLALHPLERTWLDEIVDLAESWAGGEVTVAELVEALAPPEARSSVERTVGLCLEDFSSGEDDVGRPDWDLFFSAGVERYRLRRHPVRPDTLDFIEIRFREPAVQSAYEWFAEMIGSQQPALWASADNRRRLNAFAKVMAYSEGLETDLASPAPAAEPAVDVDPLQKAGWRRPDERQAPQRP